LPASAEQLAFDAAAGSAWVQLHTAVLGVLVQDVFAAVSGAVFDTENMRAAAMRELRAATPVVDERTWPEAARRLLAATATATFLAQVRQGSWPTVITINLPGCRRLRQPWLLVPSSLLCMPIPKCLEVHAHASPHLFPILVQRVYIKCAMQTSAAFYAMSLHTLC
jgi:hypothetical protein